MWLQKPRLVNHILIEGFLRAHTHTLTKMFISLQPCFFSVHTCIVHCIIMCYVKQLQLTSDGISTHNNLHIVYLSMFNKSYCFCMRVEIPWTLNSVIC